MNQFVVVQMKNKLWRVDSYASGGRKTVCRNFTKQLAECMRAQLEAAYNAGRSKGWNDCAQKTLEHCQVIHAQLKEGLKR